MPNHQIWKSKTLTMVMRSNDLILRKSWSTKRRAHGKGSFCSSWLRRSLHCCCHRNCDHDQKFIHSAVRASSKTIRLRSIRIIIWILLRFTTCESEWWQCTMMLMVSPLKDVNSTWASIAAFLSFAYLFGSKSRPTLKLNWFHLLFAEMQFKTKLY